MLLIIAKIVIKMELHALVVRQIIYSLQKKTNAILKNVLMVHAFTNIINVFTRK